MTGAKKGKVSDYLALFIAFFLPHSFRLTTFA